MDRLKNVKNHKRKRKDRKIIVEKGSRKLKIHNMRLIFDKRNLKEDRRKG